MISGRLLVASHRQTPSADSRSEQRAGRGAPRMPIHPRAGGGNDRDVASHGISAPFPQRARPPFLLPRGKRSLCNYRVASDEAPTPRNSTCVIPPPTRMNEGSNSGRETNGEVVCRGSADWTRPVLGRSALFRPDRMVSSAVPTAGGPVPAWKRDDPPPEGNPAIGAAKTRVRRASIERKLEGAYHRTAPEFRLVAWPEGHSDLVPTEAARAAAPPRAARDAPSSSSPVFFVQQHRQSTGTTEAAGALDEKRPSAG